MLTPYCFTLDGMTPKTLRRDAEENRVRLLEAAGELFTTRGLDVTLDDVAEHAGVGVATAYRRFANKDELIDALLEDRIDAMVAIAEESLADPDPWAGLSGYLERTVALQVADRGLKQVLYAQRRGAKRVASAKRRLKPMVTQLVERAHEAGVVRSDFQPSDVPLINLMAGTVVDFSRQIEPDLYKRYLAILLAGIRAGAEPAQLPEPPLPMPRFEAAMREFTPR